MAYNGQIEEKCRIL